MNLTNISLAQSITSWFDTQKPTPVPGGESVHSKIDWPRVVPFIVMHLGCIGIVWVGVSYTALVTALLLYIIRMLAITGFYHRYFSHKTYKTSRTFQFIAAIIGASAVQRGPLWWASHHRHHHIYSDKEQDSHSPIQRGFLWSHIGWFLSRENFACKQERVKDLSKYAELRWLDRYDIAVPLFLLLALYVIGEVLGAYAPHLQTNGWQLVVWGFFVSTVFLYHATYTVNSLAHKIGKTRYNTNDHSKNSLLIALITFGEGWHNNHHRYPMSASQGFHWWQIDITYYFLKLLAALKIIWDVQTVPQRVKNEP